MKKMKKRRKKKHENNNLHASSVGDHLTSEGTSTSGIKV